jgi:hypothetical protein
MVIRCTPPVLKAMGTRVATLASADFDPDDVYVTMIEADRKRCVVAMHAQTLLSVTVRDVRTAQLRHLGSLLGIEFDQLLRDMVLPTDLVVVSPQAPITAAASHGLAGALSEIERAVADQLADGYVMDLDIRALNLEMQEVAHLGAGDKVTPRSRAMALWERRLMAG